MYHYEYGQNVDLPQIMCSEMMPVPLSLAELNGSLRSGDKALLQKRLLENINCPHSIDFKEKSSSLIIDGQALVFLLGKGENCKTFKDQANVFIQCVIKDEM